MSYMDAMLANLPGAQCAINEETGEIIEWHGPGDQPSDQTLSSWKVEYDKTVNVT